MKQKNGIWLCQFITIGFLLMLATNCKKEDSIPLITTADISNITYTTAMSGGDVTSDGGAFVSVRGLCWSTSPAPDVSGNKTINGLGVGTFIVTLTGLTPGTTYYLRAYATNSVGTAYGKEISFTTESAGLPTLTTTELTAITSSTALSGGFVALENGSDITACGVCWGTSPGPTIADNKTTDGTGTGAFTSSLTGLTPKTTYYIRAYATNSVGTAYGNELSFTTEALAEPPTLITIDVSEIGETTAKSGGEITDDGGADITARGVCWSTTPGPTTSNNKTSDGIGPGIFTSSISELKPNTTYYLRAYATNRAGTGYGNEVTFKTIPIYVPPRAGWWKFDDPANLLKAEIGLDLELTGEIQSIDGPITGNKAINIGTGSHLGMTHGISANGGGSLVNEYTIQIDFSVPTETLGDWCALFKIGPYFDSDSDLWIRPNHSIGVTGRGVSTRTLTANTWYRMILSVKNGEYWKLYIDGELWIDGEAAEVDGGWGLQSVFYLFRDNDGEDLPINCSETAIWGVGLTAKQAGALGNAYQ